MFLLKNGSEKNRWIALLSLWVLHGLIAFWQVYTYSPDRFALSSPRLLIGAFPLLWVALNIGLIVLLVKREINIDGYLASSLRDTVFFAAAAVILLRVSLWYLGGLFEGEALSRYVGYLKVLSPLLDLLAYAAAESAVLNAFVQLRNKVEIKRFPPNLLIRLGIVFAVLGIIVVLVSLTGLGIAPNYEGDWSRGLPAVPLLEWQIILACTFCTGVVFFETRNPKRPYPHIEYWICLIIWAGTSLLWLSQPVLPNDSVARPREPNFEIYPFIDSQTYDGFAQSALIGIGFGEKRIPPRPIYIVFLTLVHVLVGQDYQGMILVQSLFFAVFPVLLYLFGREFFGRPIGVSIALLAVLRDYVSNLVSTFTGNLSYSKVFLSEFPAAILLLIFLLIGVRWIRSGYPSLLSFLMGGVLGVAMLVRTQVVVALPVVALFAILVQPKSIRHLTRSLILVLPACALVISPWLWRNWQLTGRVIFDSPEYQTINLALRYSRLNGVQPDVMPQPDESYPAYSARLKQMTFAAISSNPSGAVWGIANSYLNHAVDNILLLPLRNEIQSLEEIWVPTDAFWEKWDGTPTLSQSILLAFYVSLFGLGIVVAWQRNGWLGLLPLGLNLIYNLWTSLALLSGQRFMITMDWSVYLYYMIGIFTLLGGFLYLLDGGRTLIMGWISANPFLASLPALEARPRQYLFAGILFLGIGLSLPLTENAFPERYPPRPQGQLLADLLASPALDQPSVISACLQFMAKENDLKLVQGRALYPRYYIAGDGESTTDKAGYKAVDESRLVFDLIGQENRRIIFPMTQSPDFFPHASDVTLIYAPDGALWFIFVEQGEDERFYVSDAFQPSQCRLH